MELNVKLVGTFARYLSNDAKGGVMQVSVDDNTSVSELVGQLNLPPGKPCMVSVNDQLVPTSQRDETLLQPSDEIKIIPPLKGG